MLHFRGTCLDVFTLDDPPFQAPPHRPCINFGAKVLPFRHTGINPDRAFCPSPQKTRSPPPKKTPSAPSIGVPQRRFPSCRTFQRAAGRIPPPLPPAHRCSCCSVAVLQFSKGFPPTPKGISIFIYYINIELFFTPQNSCLRTATLQRCNAASQLYSSL